MTEITEDDIETINLNEWKVTASPKKPTAILIWNDITPKESHQLKQRILQGLKLLELLERLTKCSCDDCLAQVPLEKEIQKILEESKK